MAFYETETFNKECDWHFLFNQIEKGGDALIDDGDW